VEEDALVAGLAAPDCEDLADHHCEETGCVCVFLGLDCETDWPVCHWADLVVQALTPFLEDRGEHELAIDNLAVKCGHPQINPALLLDQPVNLLIMVIFFRGAPAEGGGQVAQGRVSEVGVGWVVEVSLIGDSDTDRGLIEQLPEVEPVILHDREVREQAGPSLDHPESSKCVGNKFGRD
jgi:hypothetical protein